MENDVQIIQYLKGSPAKFDQAVKFLCNSPALKEAVKKLVFTMGGHEKEAEETFWQGLEIMISNISKDKFRGDSSLKTYLLAISRNTFLKNRPPNTNVELSVIENVTPPVPSPEELHIEHDQAEQMSVLYRYLMERVSQKCKTIFEMLKRGTSMQVIAEELGMEKVQSAQNAVYRCRKKLRQMITNDHGLKRKINELL